MKLSDKEFFSNTFSGIYKVTHFKISELSHHIVPVTFNTSPSQSSLKKINKNRNKLSSNGIQILQAEKGSLVVWTRMSNELFQSKDFFLDKFRLFLEHFFQHSGLDITDENIDVHVQISGRYNNWIFGIEYGIIISAIILIV